MELKKAATIDSLLFKRVGDRKCFTLFGVHLSAHSRGGGFIGVIRRFICVTTGILRGICRLLCGLIDLSYKILSLPSQLLNHTGELGSLIFQAGNLFSKRLGFLAQAVLFVSDMGSLVSVLLRFLFVVQGALRVLLRLLFILRCRLRVLLGFLFKLQDCLRTLLCFLFVLSGLLYVLLCFYFMVRCLLRVLRGFRLVLSRLLRMLRGFRLVLSRLLTRLLRFLFVLSRLLSGLLRFLFVLG